MAKRSGFDGVFLDGTTGLPLIGLDIAVYNSSGSTLSTIYTTKEGNTLKTNPFQTTSGSAGLVQFWAEPGYYEIEVSDSLSRISTRRIPFDAVAGDTSLGDEGISLDQIPSIETSKIQNDAITADKLRDDATTDANRAVTTNHIRNDAITSPKLNLTSGATQLNANLGFTSPSSWDTILTLSGLGSGLILAIATLVVSGNGEIKFGLLEQSTSTLVQETGLVNLWTDLASVSDVPNSNHRHTMDTSVSLAYIWQTGGTISLEGYGGNGKETIKAGSSLVAVRIG